eukprot:4929233-Pleurochrysis_carterae.AAC.1
MKFTVSTSTIETLGNEPVPASSLVEQELVVYANSTGDGFFEVHVSSEIESIRYNGMRAAILIETKDASGVSEIPRRYKAFY